MKVSLLGPLTVVADDGEQVVLRGRLQRAVLTALLLSANKAVSIDRLCAAAWGPDSPDASAAALHNHMMRLRRSLGPDIGDRVRTLTPGYLIRVLDGELDVDTFTALCASGRRSFDAGDWEAASSRLSEALELWRGDPCPDLADTAASAAPVQSLSELRLSALQTRIEADLNLGRHLELVAEIRALCRQYPLAEDFHRQLMLALYLGERRSEALDAYQGLRRTLVEELGIEPSARVRALQNRILMSGTASGPGGGPDAREDAGPGPQPAETPPSQLPRDVADFLGRDGELAVILERAGRQNEGDVLLEIVDGMAGVGKTTLAVRAAHLLSPRYPDGQIFLDLRGHTPGHAPLEPAEALRTLLGSLGVADRMIPDGLEARAAAWRTRLAGRRLIVVFDNAANAAQVRPLLPGASSTLVLVTSRRRLLGLDDAAVHSLDVLPESEAVALLSRAIGDRRAADDPRSLAETARICGRLPLAIRIAAARLRHRPAWSVADLAERLRDQHHRLDELAGEDRAIAGAFAVSYEHLSAHLRRTFRLLAAVPGHDFDAYVIAALTGVGVPEAEDHAEQLLDVHLLQQYIPGRYRFHDLMRAHAADLLRKESTAEEHGAAVDALFGYYRRATAAAADLLTPERSYVLVGPEPPACRIPRWSDGGQAMAWLDMEYQNIQELIVRSVELGRDADTWHLPRELWTYFYTRGLNGDWRRLAGRALEAAERLGHGQALGIALSNVGMAEMRLGHFDPSLERFTDSLTVMQRIGHVQGQASALNNMNIILSLKGRPAHALRLARQSAELYRGLGQQTNESLVVGNIGATLIRAGRYAEAAECFERTLVMVRANGIAWAECRGLNFLGDAASHLGRHEQALAHLAAALKLARSCGDPISEAICLGLTAGAHTRAGDPDTALPLHQQALDLICATDDTGTRAEILNGLADTLVAAGAAAASADHRREALRLAQDASARFEEGRALSGLAEVPGLTREEAERLRREGAAVLREFHIDPDDE